MKDDEKQPEPITAIARKFVYAKGDPRWPGYHPALDENTLEVGKLRAIELAERGAIVCVLCGARHVGPKPDVRRMPPGGYFGAVREARGCGGSAPRAFGYALCTTCAWAPRNEGTGFLDRLRAELRAALGAHEAAA